MDRIGFKRCAKCGEIKGLSWFNRNRSLSDGFDRYCRVCRNQVARSRKQRNKERNLKKGITITEKRCTKCGKIKSIEDFCKDLSTKDGLSYWCKSCLKQYNKKQRENAKKYTDEHGIPKRKRCTKCGKTKDASEFDKKSGSRDGLNSPCKECASKDARKFYKKHRKQILKYHQNRKKEAAQYIVDRYHSNPMIRLSMCMSTAIRKSLKRKGGSKHGYHWEDILGYTLQQLRERLESLFKEGMTWENYGEWHVDHIRPVSGFHFISIDDPEFQQCWALENLQPLWAEENMRKGAKRTWCQKR
jgi:hypothetical protein